MPDSDIVHKGAAFAIVAPDSHCDLERMHAAGWWDCYWVLRWDRAGRRFRAISPAMLGRTAAAWPAEHGYKGYY